MKKKLSIKNLFSLAWADYKKHWKIALLALIPVAILDLINGFFGVQEEGEWVGGQWMTTGVSADALSITVSVIAFFATMYITMGLVKIYLNIADGKKAEFIQNFNGADTIGHYFLYMVTYIINSLAIVLPMMVIMMITVPVALLINLKVSIFIIIFGSLVALAVMLYLAMALQFSYYFSIENRYHLFSSLKKSWAMTKGHRLQLLLILLSIIVLNIIGLLALVVGLLVTIPVTMLIYSHAYRQLDPEVDMHMEAPEETEEAVEIAVEQ